jgi:hypothetical protein
VRKLVTALAISGLAALVLASPSNAQRFSNNDRRAVVLEAFYALRPSADGSCDKFINGNCVSNWNFLNSDYSSYNYMKSVYGCYASDWALSGDNCYPYMPFASFYSNVGSYGYGTFGGSYGNLGRGGQCRFFANLLVYRSGSSSVVFPTYASMWNNVETDLTKAVEGDVLTVNPAYSSSLHTAIVVEIKRSGSTVVGLDLIDANWLTDTGSPNREVIGRHELFLSGLPVGEYGLWKGVSYYYEPYIP